MAIQAIRHRTGLHDPASKIHGTRPSAECLAHVMIPRPESGGLREYSDVRAVRSWDFRACHLCCHDLALVSSAIIFRLASSPQQAALALRLLIDAAAIPAPLAGGTRAAA